MERLEKKRDALYQKNGEILKKFMSARRKLDKEQEKSHPNTTKVEKLEASLKKYSDRSIELREKIQQVSDEIADLSNPRL